jgi:membrane protein implicated in regulation of membrane protease activity
MKHKMVMKRGSKVLGLFILSLLIVSFTAGIVSAAEDEEAKELIITVANFLPIKVVLGSPAESVDTFQSAYGEEFENMPLGDASAVIIHIVFWLMMFFAFSDIFGGFLPFQNKYVPWVLGGGLTIIVANLGVIPMWLVWMAGITAWAGAFAIFASMIIAFIAFIAVVIFGNLLKVRMLKRKYELAGQVGGKKVGVAIEQLAKIEESLEKASK